MAVVVHASNIGNIKKFNTSGCFRFCCFNSCLSCCRQCLVVVAIVAVDVEVASSLVVVFQIFLKAEENQKFNSSKAFISSGDKCSKITASSVFNVGYFAKNFCSVPRKMIFFPKKPCKSFLWTRNE